MLDLLNMTAAALTIAFGAFGFLAPRYTAQALDLAPTDSTMGLSEMRASVGGLFVASGVCLPLLDMPAAWAGLGIAYAGAASGRVLSALLDRPPMRKLVVFGGIEAALAAWLLLANLPLALQSA
ncbi:MAG: DUF4345 family protein [Oceanicola sp.]|nr:DUF4345 family protein [Oceanicola sp.]